MSAAAATAFNLVRKVVTKSVAFVLVVSAALEATDEGAAAVKVALAAARLPATTAILLDTPSAYVRLSLEAQPLPDWTFWQSVAELALVVPFDEEVEYCTGTNLCVHEVITLQFALLVIVHTSFAVAELAYAHAYVMPALVVGKIEVWVMPAKVSVCTTVDVVPRQILLTVHLSFFACVKAALALFLRAPITTDVSVQTQGFC